MSSPDTSRLDTTCLVVGAGPVGMTAARLLSQHGVDSVLAERRTGPQTVPAAHVVNARSLEIWRRAGFDMDAIDGIAKDPADAGHVNFLTRLGGDLIGRLPFEQQGADMSDVTPTPLRNISQHRLEPLLAARLVDDPRVDLRRGTEWIESRQDEDGVTSTLRSCTTAETIEVRSRYVIAADGAGSRIRRSLGIEMIGPASLQHFIAIHVAVDVRELVADRPGVLHFVMDPAVSGCFVAHDVDRESVFMTNYDPRAESIDDYGTERCDAIVRAAIGSGADDLQIEVLGVGVWNMSAQVADGMRSGRIFLAGDAAHRFPPTGGLGLNTGVADADGLAWRIGAIEAGRAGDGLLESYESERRPVAQANCQQSTRNAFEMIHLSDALGLLDAPTSEQLHRSLADPARRSSIDAAVERQATHFDMLGLQLGYCYADGALLRSGDPPPPIEDPRHFEPSAAVGSRLPHVWLRDGRSTLDLIAHDAMTLLTVADHDTWAEIAADAPVPVHHVRIGLDVEVEPRLAAAWQRACSFAPGEALLVRPDQHVAWRSSQRDGLDLDAALVEILSLTPANGRREGAEST